MIIEKHILIIRNVLYKSSHDSPFVQVSHQPIWGSRPVLILLTQGGGGQNFGKPADLILEHSLMGFDTIGIKLVKDKLCLAF